MNVERALDQITEIHAHLRKSEVYRGFHSYPVALSGVSALGAAWAQGPLGWATVPHDYVLYWVALAVANVAMIGGVMAWRYWRLETPSEQRRTRLVVGQFAPTLGAGIVVTAAMFGAAPEWLALMPGLWAMIFSLGLFATRLSLPHGVGWTALFYFAAAAVMLLWARGGGRLSPWLMGATFGTGQILSALFLYWNFERRRSHERAAQ